MKLLVSLFLACLVASAAAQAQETPHIPSLLLTPKLLRRLQRDRERQTVRWQNFEQRVQSGIDSSERGFELALYYAITHDRQRGEEAIAWAVVHKCERRETALVLDWIGDAISPQQRKALEEPGCKIVTRMFVTDQARNNVFLAIAKDQDPQPAISSGWPAFRQDVHNTRLLAPKTLYQMCEFLLAARSSTRNDLRTDEPQFFSHLPKEFLLSLKPDQVEHPDWMAHIAALALVSIDPNMENSQFLQGWAMEESQMLRDGPGVAYEFLWADPYLPGIAYQNMDPWTYDPAGILFARDNWDAKSCWTAISPVGTQKINCETSPAQARQFGTLKLLAIASPCLNVPARINNQSVIVSSLKPKAPVTFERNKQRTTEQADPGGMWPVPNDTAGKVCVASQNRR